MAVIQEAFDIPDDIAVGLATGIYKRFGGVVRWAVGSQKGQIVKHLKPIQLPEAVESGNRTQKALELFTHNKKTTYIAAIVLGTAVAGGVAYSVHNSSKRKKFHNAFQAYIEAIRTGTMTISLIEEMEKALSEVDSIKMTPEELSVLVSHIKDYTIKLANDNGEEVSNLKISESPIIDFKKYLEMQKRIIETA